MLASFKNSPDLAINSAGFVSINFSASLGNVSTQYGIIQII